jgi:signal transduction histidine kinase
MIGDQPPYEKLRLFKERIGIGPEEMEVLKPFRSVFTSRKHEFADYFYRTFSQITETKLMLGEDRWSFLKSRWAEWFGSVFTVEIDDRFLGYLWRIGVRHVEVNLDQRFSNLGFAMIRQFCQRIILTEISPDKSGLILATVDRLLDLCLLVETSAYIEVTTRCDIEVIRAVADRVRNPALVIGGNIKRLQKTVGSESREFHVYERLIAENERLEKMFQDIKVYVDVFSKEIEFHRADLKELIVTVLGKMKEAGMLHGVEVELDLGAEVLPVRGDAEVLECLFQYLIQNAVEGADGMDPRVKISARSEKTVPRNVLVELFNTGNPPRKEEIEQLFSPFYSTKPSGTGFGLPIAGTIVSKHFGKLVMEPVPGKGTKVLVRLPAAE